MPFLNNIIHGVKDASKVMQHAVRATGKMLNHGSKHIYANRDLISKGISLAAPIVSAGITGLSSGPIGGLIAAGGAAINDADKISEFVKDVGKRASGKTKGGGNIDPNVKADLFEKGTGIVSNANGNLSKNVRNRLKVLAEGQTI